MLASRGLDRQSKKNSILYPKGTVTLEMQRTYECALRNTPFESQLLRGDRALNYLDAIVLSARLVP